MRDRQNSHTGPTTPRLPVHHFVTRGPKKTLPTRHKISTHRRKPKQTSLLLDTTIMRAEPANSVTPDPGLRVTRGLQKTLPTRHPILTPPRNPKQISSLSRGQIMCAHPATPVSGAWPLPPGKPCNIAPFAPCGNHLIPPVPSYTGSLRALALLCAPPCTGVAKSLQRSPFATVRTTA